MRFTSIATAEAPGRWGSLRDVRLHDDTSARSSYGRTRVPAIHAGIPNEELKYLETPSRAHRSNDSSTTVG